MRKLGYLVLAATLVSAVPAAANSSKGRTERGEYNSLTLTTDPSPATQGSISNGVRFDTLPKEKYVSVTVMDEFAEDVRAVVGQDVDGDGVENKIAEICTTSSAPIKITPGVPVTVWTQEGTCADGTLSTPTFGTIEAMFMTKAAQHRHH